MLEENQSPGKDNSQLASEETNKAEEKQIDNTIFPPIPDIKEASLWENTDSINVENNKKLEIIGNKNHIELLDETNNNQQPSPNTKDKNSTKELNKPPNSAEAESNPNVINLNSNNSKAEKEKGIKNKNESNIKMNKKEKKSNTKRLKDIINDNRIYTDNNERINTEMNIIEIKNKILNNNKFKSKESI